MTKQAMTKDEDSTVVDEREGVAWWPYPVILVLVVAVLFLCYRSTALSILEIWMRSDTYAHGFLILPISAWLVWERRSELKHLPFQGAVVPLLLLLPIGMIWFAAHIVDVLVVQQFAFVLAVVLSIWAVIGATGARIIAFPLFFLLFAVPVGDGLIPPLMEFTADFTVAMLKLTGIPVFREGNFFSIPSGDWSVVESCSGFRYLVASVTLGTLYAYLTYSKWWKRLVFVGLSIVVPILANGFRAYLIVMIGHLSDMKLAVGFDHLVYGWVFFGIIIAVMFAIGGIWRDPHPHPHPEAGPVKTNTVAAADIRKISVYGILVVVFGGIWPILSASTDEGSLFVAPVEIVAPPSSGGWLAQDDTAWSWRPNMIGVDGEMTRFYQRDGADIGLYIGVYRSQRQGAELVSSGNSVVASDNVRWRKRTPSSRKIPLGEDSVVVAEDAFDKPNGDKLVIWSWYRLGTTNTGNPVYAKVADALNRVFGSSENASLIAVSYRYSGEDDAAVEQLADFVGEMLPAIEATVEEAVAPAH